MALTAALLMQLSTRETGNLVYLSIINYLTQLVLCCACQALLLSLCFSWRVSPVLNKMSGKYLTPLSSSCTVVLVSCKAGLQQGILPGFLCP